MGRNRIGIIGSGATALYTLAHLIACEELLDVTIFESNRKFGTGMPYRPGVNADYMLCNAFSREIPPITQSLLEWLKQLPKRELSDWEFSFHDLSGRAFYPRLLIGEFLEHELLTLCKRAQQLGHIINFRSNECVTDVIPSPNGKVTEQLNAMSLITL